MCKNNIFFLFHPHPESSKQRLSRGLIGAFCRQQLRLGNLDLKETLKRAGIFQRCDFASGGLGFY